MANFTVKWVIDIETSTAKDAATLAWEIMKEKENSATFLDVYDQDDNLITSYDMFDTEDYYNMFDTED